jgi:hypothetical protein
MNGFMAIVLICATSVSVEDCDEAHAIDVLAKRVNNELVCTMGWQEVIARSGLQDGLGATTYIKTICRKAMMLD